jgi:zinc protease
MRFAMTLFGAGLTALWAQQPGPPQLTAEQIIEKSIAAQGGRQAITKITSTVAKGTLEIPGQGVTAALELHAKIPAKRLVLVKMEAFGEIRRGCDGQSAWEDNPNTGFRALEGEERDEMLRDCVFQGELKWRELYPKVELLGKEKLSGREVYKVEMTPASGKPVTRFYDAETFLIAAQTMKRVTAQGTVDVRVEVSDYREVDGVKGAFLVKQITAGQEIIIKIAEVKNNVAIEDALFAKPAGK